VIFHEPHKPPDSNIIALDKWCSGMSRRNCNDFVVYTLGWDMWDTSDDGPILKQTTRVCTPGLCFAFTELDGSGTPLRFDTCITIRDSSGHLVGIVHLMLHYCYLTGSSSVLLILHLI